MVGIMFRYDIQCDNSYSEHTRYVCSLTPQTEAGDDQLTHNLVCLTILGLGLLLICCCWIKTSCCLDKSTKKDTVEPHYPPPPPPPPPDCLETCGECQEDERRRSQELEECPGWSECCCCHDMEQISPCQATLQPGQPSVRKTPIKRVSNIEKKINKNNSLRK